MALLRVFTIVEINDNWIKNKIIGVPSIETKKQITVRFILPIKYKIVQITLI